MQSLAWNQTRTHATNGSVTKATHAFPKENRFKGPRQLNCDSFYNIPSKLGKAPASGIGRGSKVNLINPNVKTPSPSHYHIKSALSLSKVGGKFGMSRDKLKYNGIFSKSETPEPGHYQQKSQFESKQGGFTIYSKLALPIFSNAKNPGPAAYQSTDSFNSQGRYVLSQLSNCSGYKIKPTKTGRVSVNSPGPAHYDASTDNLNTSGKYFTSKNQNSRCRTFSRSSKTSQLKLNSPGPAAYNCFSEFGRKQ